MTKRTKDKHDEDKSYFEDRAEEELKKAQRSNDAQAVAAHYELACRYLDKAHPQPADRSTSLRRQ
jgi:hypothetical protein